MLKFDEMCQPYSKQAIRELANRSLVLVKCKDGELCVCELELYGSFNSISLRRFYQASYVREVDVVSFMEVVQ